MAPRSTPASRPISSRRAGDFFKSRSRRPPAMMARAGRQLAIVHGAQFAAHRLLDTATPKFFENPLAEVDDPPAPPREPPDRAASMIAVSAARWSSFRRGFGPGALRSIRRRAARIELQHPVADDLQRHPRSSSPARVALRRSPPTPATAAPAPVLRTLRRGSHHRGVKIGPTAIGMANLLRSPP